MLGSSNLEAYLEEAEELLREARNNRHLVEQSMQAVEVISAAVGRGKPLLTCGNGGSASDALHISGELVGRFHHNRRAINVVCLNSNVTVITAWANDVAYDSVFARQVEAHGASGGVLWGLSTSGNSRNVVNAFNAARNLGMVTVAMTGSSPGLLGEIADIVIAVPGKDAPSAQNLHVLLYHFICAKVESSVLGAD